MAIPMHQEGHTGSFALPCTVYGLYNALTGTLIFETVYCDGRNFDMLEIASDELEKFQALLKEVAMDSEF